jgi:hypothetical protein
VSDWRRTRAVRRKKRRKRRLKRMLCFRRSRSRIRRRCVC